MLLGSLDQYLINGLVLGVIYAMVAVGFTLFFGVLNVIKFSHGDVLMAGAFAALISYIFLQNFVSPDSIWIMVVTTTTFKLSAMGSLVPLSLVFQVLPLQAAPPLNTLLITLMLGLAAVREAVRLFYPNGSNPKPFPKLLPDTNIFIYGLEIRYDSLIIIFGGLAAIFFLHLLIKKNSFRAFNSSCRARFRNCSIDGY